MLDVKKIKKDFPIFKNQGNLSYLDNAATAQVSRGVINAMGKYYSESHANSHSESHKLGFKAFEKYEQARETVAKFLNAEFTEIIFTSGTTYGLNALANSIGQNLTSGDNAVLTRMEHHSNLAPWLISSKKYGFELRFIEMDDNFELDLASAEKVIDKNTKVVSVAHISNALGTINPIAKIISLAKKAKAISIIDAAQSVSHIKIDVKKIDCDFLVFSGHKIGSPSGIGVLYGKEEKLEKLAPFMTGGGMVNVVDYNKVSWNSVPYRFEAGSVNIAGAIGLAQALKYLEKISMKKVARHGEELTEYALKRLNEFKQVKIIGPKNKNNRVGVISFSIENIHPHDIASILDQNNVAVRAGHHCTMPLMKLLGLNGTTRASFWIYNDKKDVDKLINGLKNVIRIFTLKPEV